MTIKKLLDEISVIPGVTGSCIFDRNGGPLCTNSDATVATDILMKVGSYLIRTLKLGKMVGIQVAGSAYRFDNCTIVGTPLDSDTLLVTVCSAKANCSLIATTAAMLVSDIKEQLQKNEGSLQDVEPEPEKSNDSIESEQEEQINLQDCFSQIEEALAEAIGPVAGMILQDAIVKWQQNGAATATRLNELLEILEHEIGDDNLVLEFRTRTQQFS